jgi:hypothetical protein
VSSATVNILLSFWKNKCIYKKRHSQLPTNVRHQVSHPYKTTGKITVLPRTINTPDNGVGGSLHPQQQNCCVYPSAWALVRLHVPNHIRLAYYTDTHTEPNRKSPSSLMKLSQVHSRPSYTPYSISIPITSPSYSYLSPPSFLPLQYMSLQKNNLKYQPLTFCDFSEVRASSDSSGKQNTHFQTNVLL